MVNELSGSSPIESEKVLVGGWRWIQRSLSDFPPIIGEFERNWLSLL